jgi:hypothetical protein
MMTETKTVELGTVSEIQKLFSYPGNAHEIRFLKRTLEDTISHYVSASIRRDGYHDSGIKVWTEDNHVLIEITGAAAKVYADVLPRFLAAGRIALAASRDLAQIPWETGGWRYNWRFFLPLGVAMTQHLTVQLLHFPPDSVLERDEDYLKASTTKRWARLLIENDVKETDTERYQNIIDLAPISAPSDDGRNLDTGNVYDFYETYIVALLKEWLPRQDQPVRPMVAFGSPVRRWIKSKFNLSQGPDVLSLEDLPVTNTLRVKTLFANHPSYIFNADDRLKDDPNTALDERLPALMLIVQQDLIAARWQARMGATPTADARTILEECKTYWSDPARQERICVLTCLDSLGVKTPDEAAKKCAELPKAKQTFAEVMRDPTSGTARHFQEVLDRVRTDVGSLDARSPKVLTLNNTFQAQSSSAPVLSP